MSAKDKKEALADLNEALKAPAPPIQEQGQYRPWSPNITTSSLLRWVATSSNRSLVGKCR